MSRTGRLLFPALRWQRESGFAHERDVIAQAQRIGVGGYCIFGGDADAVHALIRELHASSEVPLLIASDCERGAGQQFPQATPLPPLAALGAIDDTAITRAAGALTAREALAVGVNWILAPVADVDLEPLNPIVGTRAFGSDPDRVAAHVAAWIEGCRSEGALCCAKHFPGHGRTTTDSHATLPRVGASPEMMEQDLRPFRAAIAAGVDALMSAHVAYDAFDDPDRGAVPATLSRAILHELARHELGFAGLIVSDAMNMAGVLEGGQGSAARAAIRALNAGCDALLYPADLRGLAASLEAALGGELDAERVAAALQRIAAVADSVQAQHAGGWGAAEHRAWADAVARRSLTVIRGEPRAAQQLDLLTIDDDVGGPHPAPARTSFGDTLRELGCTVRDVTQPSPPRPLLIAIYADIRAWKGRPGLSTRAVHALDAALEQAPDAVVVLFGHARLAAPLPGSHVLGAWGGESLMQRAAAHRVVDGA